MYKILIVLIVLISCSPSTISQEQQATYQLIEKEELTKHFETEKEVQLIDVRTANEYNQGAILNAINLDLLDGTFEKNIDKLDPSKPVFLYCAKGGRSKKAAQILKEKDFSLIYDLKGGYSSWVENEKR